MNRSNEAAKAMASNDSADVSRRNVLKMTGTGVAALSVGVFATGPASARSQSRLGDTWDKTFARSDKVNHKKIAFHTDLYDRMDVIPFDKLAAFFR